MIGGAVGLVRRFRQDNRFVPSEVAHTAVPPRLPPSADRGGYRWGFLAHASGRSRCC